MGVFDWLGRTLGLDLSSRLRKALIIFIFIGGVGALLAIVDPLFEYILSFAVGRHVELPFTIPEIASYFGDLWPPLSIAMTYAKNSTLQMFWMTWGICFSVLAIIFQGDPDNPLSVPATNVIGRTLSRLAQFGLNRQASYEDRELESFDNEP